MSKKVSGIDRTCLGIFSVHSLDLCVREISMEQPRIREHGVGSERLDIGDGSHQMEAVHSIVSGIESRNLDLLLGVNRRGKIQLKIDGYSRLMEAFHHVGEFLLRSSLITGRAVSGIRRVIKAAVITPVIDFFDRQILYGKSALTYRVKSKGVLHSAGTVLCPCDRLKLIDRHQLHCIDP